MTDEIQWVTCPYCGQSVAADQVGLCPKRRRFYRIYADGIEFGIDYRSLERAREVKRSYQQEFPKVRYYIRRVH